MNYPFIKGGFLKKIIILILYSVSSISYSSTLEELTVKSEMSSNQIEKAGLLSFLKDLFGSNSTTNPNPAPLKIINYETKYTPPPPKIVSNVSRNVGGATVFAAANEKVDQYNPCWVVVNERTAANGFKENERDVFVPTKTLAEWESFKNKVSKKLDKSGIAKVSLKKCERIVTHTFAGACRHIQNDNYENRDTNPAYLMTCTRTVDLESITGGPQAGERVTEITISAQMSPLGFSESGNLLQTSNTNTLCAAGFSTELSNISLLDTSNRHTTTTEPSGSATLESEYEYKNASTKPIVSLRNKYTGSSGVKYDERVYKFDSASNKVSVTSNWNGWGDCRESTCAACVGDVRVTFKVE